MDSKRDIKFIPLDFNNLAHCQFLFESQTDPRWQHLVIPHGPRFPAQSKTIDEFKASLTHVSEKKEHYLISYQEEFIGDISLIMNPPHLFDKKEHTAWLGIGLYDEKWHGQNIALQAMSFIEERSISKGANRMEIGIFEFNSRSLAFAQKFGFKIIGRIEDFTIWNNKSYADFRLEKRLAP